MIEKVVSDSFHEGNTTKEGNKSLFSYPASPFSQKADAGSYSNFSLSMTRESTKAPKLFVPILLSERTTMKEPGHLLVFLLIFLPTSLIKGCPNTKRAEIAKINPQ